MQEEKKHVTLSIIIVNYKTLQLVKDCIHSIYSETVKLNYEIIVVDNNSGDDSENIIKQLFPSAIFIQMGYNAGFSKANNEGIKKSQGEYVLLLNPDTIVLDNAIERSINFIKIPENQNIAALGCRLKNADGSIQYSAFPEFEFHSLKKAIYANPFHIYLNRHKKIKENYYIKLEELHKKTSEVAWICGAFMLVPARIFKKENIWLDEDFFMYSEDFEWCFRLKKANYKIVYFPNACIIHLSGASYDVRKDKIKQIIYSEWLCIMKCYGKLYFIINQLIWLLNLFLDSFFYLKEKILRNKKKINNVDFSLHKLMMEIFINSTFCILLKTNKHVT